MKPLFQHIPEAIINIQEVVDKVEIFDLASDVFCQSLRFLKSIYDPKDEEDGGKRGENAYLRHLTYEGAKIGMETYDEIRERLDFELADH